MGWASSSPPHSELFLGSRADSRGPPRSRYWGQSSALCLWGHKTCTGGKLDRVTHYSAHYFKLLLLQVLTKQIHSMTFSVDTFIKIALVSFLYFFLYFTPTKTLTVFYKDDFLKEVRKDNGPNLSDPSLRQRSFPSSRAVLDVTGGGERDKSQDAQEERRVRHGCWFLDERRAPVACVPRLGGCLTDVSLHSSLISTWTWPDRATDTRVWRQCRAVLLSTRTPEGHVRECGVRARGRGRYGFASEVCHLTNLRKQTAMATEDAFFCIQDCARTYLK